MYINGTLMYHLLFIRSEADLKTLEEVGRVFLDCLVLLQRFERRSQASGATSTVRSYCSTASLSLVQLASSTLLRESTTDAECSRSDNNRSALLADTTKFGWLSELLGHSADLFEQQLTTLLHAESITSSPDFLSVRKLGILLFGCSCMTNFDWNF
jgi:hypothetical protein